MHGRPTELTILTHTRARPRVPATTSETKITAELSWMLRVHSISSLHLGPNTSRPCTFSTNPEHSTHTLWSGLLLQTPGALKEPSSNSERIVHGQKIAVPWWKTVRITDSTKITEDERREWARLGSQALPQQYLIQPLCTADAGAGAWAPVINKTRASRAMALFRSTTMRPSRHGPWHDYYCTPPVKPHSERVPRGFGACQTHTAFCECVQVKCVWVLVFINTRSPTTPARLHKANLIKYHTMHKALHCPVSTDLWLHTSLFLGIISWSLWN